MIFKIDSSDSIGSFEKMREEEFSTLQEFIDYVSINGGSVTVHTYDNEPTVLEVHSAEAD